MAHSMVMRTNEGKILHIESHETLPSTHELARAYARAGYTDGYVVFSESQTKYTSVGQPLKENSKESGVFLSCIMRPSLFPSQAGFIGPMSAVALLNALEAQTDKRIGIGWISDIFCEDRKIGTTITEGKLNPDSSYDYIIVSFYAKLSESDFPPRLSNMVKKVFEIENTSISLIVAKNILLNFFTLYSKKLKSEDKSMDVYKRKFVLSGYKTKYIEDGKRKACKILGINGTDGRLIIETHGGVIKHISANKSIIIPNKIKIRSN